MRLLRSTVQALVQVAGELGFTGVFNIILGGEPNPHTQSVFLKMP